MMNAENTEGFARTLE